MSSNERRLTLAIVLSPNIHAEHTRQRCPSARLVLTCQTRDVELGEIRVDVEAPRFDVPDHSLEEVDASDVIGKVIDEAAWLAEIARVLAPGGHLRFSVPASGPLAWCDAQNIYRYIGDTLGRGDTPDATLPTGWNRHYGQDDVTTLLQDAGFTEIEIRRAGLGLAEVPQLAGLVGGNLLLGKREAELKLHPMRRAMERIDARIPAPAIGSQLIVTARRAATAPEDPADGKFPANHPAPEIGSE